MTKPVAVLLLLACATFVGCSRGVSNDGADIASLLPENRLETLSDDAYDWATAIEPREFSFPVDHGSHDEFRIEWWYYTGNVVTEEDRRFGYQLTFFRTGVQRDPENPSKWVVRDLYTGHFALSDIESRQHHSAQQSRRAGVGMAGAAADRLEVWNGRWRVEEQDGKHRLIAEEEGFAIDLTLASGKGVVLQGDNGLSQKGEAKGNASYYYSMPRMPTEGTVTVDGETLTVTGESWMDHEFSTSFLEPGQRGWDWLSLQLDDGSELMLYQMRRSDGTADPYSSGTLIGPDGERTELAASDFRLTPGRTWRSSETGAEYPVEWRVEVEPLGLKLSVDATFDAQEMATEATTGIAYWEGAVEVGGTRRDEAVTGRGYLELTGYTQTELGSMLGE